MKFLLGIACLLGALFAPMAVNVNAAESTNTKTPIVRTLNMPTEKEEVVYTYSDEGGNYVFTVKSETEIFIEATGTNGEVTSITCTYKLENDVLKLYISGELWAQFTINEDNTLNLYEEGLIPGLENVDIEEELGNLQLLVDALKKELESETFNAENLAKILIALGGTLGSILLLLLYRLLRIKILNLKNGEEYEKAKKEMAEEFAKYQAEIKELIDSLEKKVVKKIDDTEEKRQKDIEAQSLSLSEKMEEAKKNLTIDEILNEE